MRISKVNVHNLVNGENVLVFTKVILSIRLLFTRIKKITNKYDSHTVYLYTRVWLHCSCAYCKLTGMDWNLIRSVLHTEIHVRLLTVVNNATFDSTLGDGRERPGWTYIYYLPRCVHIYIYINNHVPYKFSCGNTGIYDDGCPKIVRPLISHPCILPWSNPGIIHTHEMAV